MGKSTKSKEIFYCAFCRSPHRYYAKKGIGLIHLFISILLTVCFMWGYWGNWNQQAVPILLISLSLGELTSHFRWRLALICRQCGFDPLIYQKNPDVAAQKVKEFLIRRKTEPHFLLSPTINLPKQRRNNLTIT